MCVPKECLCFTCGTRHERFCRTVFALIVTFMLPYICGSPMGTGDVVSDSETETYLYGQQCPGVFCPCMSLSVGRFVCFSKHDNCTYHHGVTTMLD